MNQELADVQAVFRNGKETRDLLHNPKARELEKNIYFGFIDYAKATLLSWAPKLLQMMAAAMKLKDSCSLEEKLWWTLKEYEKAEMLLCQWKSV